MSEGALSLMSYKTPPFGTILPPKSNVDAEGNLIVPNPGPTLNLQLYYEFIQAGEQSRAALMTQSRLADYMARFNSWLTYQYQTGHAVGPKGMGDPDALPPMPPMEYVVLVGIDGALFSVLDGGIANAKVEEFINNGGVAPEATYTPAPVCEIPAYTKIQPPQHGY